jgi:hypothetical protein
VDEHDLATPEPPGWRVPTASTTASTSNAPTIRNVAARTSTTSLGALVPASASAPTPSCSEIP